MWFWIRCEKLDSQLVLLHLSRWQNLSISERLSLLLENSWKDEKSVYFASTMNSSFSRSWSNLSKKINAMTRRIELLKVKIAVTKVDINARNIHKDQSAKVLQGILYVKEARSMISDRLGLEYLRQKPRDERIEKQYINELIKVYKRCKIHIKVWKKKEKVWKVLYKAVLKKLLVIQPFQKSFGWILVRWPIWLHDRWVLSEEWAKVRGTDKASTVHMRSINWA